MLLIEGIPSLPGCLCGRCEHRLSARASCASGAALRLGAASFRAREAGDAARAAAYAAQSRAARAEAEECGYRADVAAGDAQWLPLLAAVFRIFAGGSAPECVRLPDQWSSHFAVQSERETMKRAISAPLLDRSLYTPLYLFRSLI